MKIDAKKAAQRRYSKTPVGRASRRAGNRRWREKVRRERAVLRQIIALIEGLEGNQ